MRLTYETGTATLVQFIIASFFALFSQIGTAATSCFKDHDDCAINTMTGIVIFILISVFFGAIWLIGYAAQDRRSRRLAQLLICAEVFLGLLALLSLKIHSHTHSLAGLAAGFGLLVMAAWIITLAFRLMRAGGGRVVTHGRPRVRKRPTPPAEL